MGVHLLEIPIESSSQAKIVPPCVTRFPVSSEGVKTTIDTVALLDFALPCNFLEIAANGELCTRVYIGKTLVQTPKAQSRETTKRGISHPNLYFICILLFLAFLAKLLTESESSDQKFCWEISHMARPID